MDVEALTVEIADPETVAFERQDTDVATFSFTNTLSTPLVLDKIDIVMTGNASSNTGFLEWGDLPVFFFSFSGDSSGSGNLWREWRGPLVLYEGQHIAGHFLSGDSSATWSWQVTGHYSLGYRPAF